MSAREIVGRTSQLMRVWAILGAVVLAAATVWSLLTPSQANAAGTPPSGFQETTVFSGLTNPTALQFSKDGQVFVAEQSGLIKVFDNLSDTTPTTFADLRTKVHNYWDRGMLGLALDPNYPTNPYVYVLYTHDAPIGGTAPRWGTAGATSDGCPSPPGPTTDGCVVSGHLSRLQADPAANRMVGTEQVLIEDWCQQFPAHSVGGLVFGSDEALYVGGGDGANWISTDYGQNGGSSNSPTPKNPCGDPPGGVGATLSPPTAEGGTLRTQDLRTSGDPVGLSGSILRVDPATGNALPNNPLISNTDPNAKRIIAYGLRNPFRFTIRPGTDEIWVGDVGWNAWEEIDRITNPTDPIVENFGWPCYEGNGRQSGYDGLDLNICENLYGQTNAVSAPYFVYRHGTQVAGESCATNNGSVISALAFYKGGPYPDEYDDALFFGDHSRRCIWVMQKGTNGLPNPGQLKPFVTNAENPVDLQIGPNGDLFYVDLNNGAIRRIQYTAAVNQPPVARAAANPTSGAVPLTVSFDGTGSSDPDGDTLTYAWDLDGDGAYNDSTNPKLTYTYNAARDYQVGLRVTDSRGASDTLDQPLTISAGNTAPTATIDSPLSTTTWKVGDNISFSGSATDQQDGSLAASRLTWSLIMHHCSSQNSCHEHGVQNFAGVASGSFVAPDHEYPSYLELRLTATDSGGLSDTKSVRLDPKTAELSFRSEPAGLQVTVGSTSETTPFSRTVIVGSKSSISAPSPQTLAGTSYEFVSWSDGGARSHDVVAPDAAATYTATYTPAPTAANGLKGEYYDNQDLTNLKLTRTDPKVDFSWGSGSPDSSIAPDTFSVRWSGQVKADHTETYTFYTSTNDGARLWVNGQQIINRWSDGALTNTGTIPLQAGQWYPITMEYYEGINTASAKLEYSSSSTQRQVILTDHLRPDAPSDVTAPTISGVAPAEGATGVGVGANAEATFSEAVNASTISGSTFTLTKQGTTQPLIAHVSYEAATRTARLDPTADLEAGTTYTATVKGGADGVKDLAGNPLGADKTWSFTTAAAPPPDTTPPETTIDSGPSGTVRDKTATFTFSSSEPNSTFECKLDGAAFGACSSPRKYTGLANGTHTFAVRAKDASGNTDASPATRTWTIRR